MGFLVIGVEEMIRDVSKNINCKSFFTILKSPPVRHSSERIIGIFPAVILCNISSAFLIKVLLNDYNDFLIPFGRFKKMCL